MSVFNLAFQVDQKTLTNEILIIKTKTTLEKISRFPGTVLELSALENRPGAIIKVRHMTNR